jgi:hypothetical protein
MRALSSVSAPIATLPVPVVLALSASSPMPTLSVPLSLFCSAKAPMPMLCEPVVLLSSAAVPIAAHEGLYASGAGFVPDTVKGRTSFRSAAARDDCYVPRRSRGYRWGFPPGDLAGTLQNAGICRA